MQPGGGKPYRHSYHAGGSGGAAAGQMDNRMAAVREEGIDDNEYNQGMEEEDDEALRHSFPVSTIISQPRRLVSTLPTELRKLPSENNDDDDEEGGTSEDDDDDDDGGNMQGMDAAAATAAAGIDPALFADDGYMDDAQYEAWLQQMAEEDTNNGQLWMHSLGPGAAAACWC